MWLLTCDGELLGGKPLWLRPGSTHLLGRTTGRSDGGARVRYIEHKSVSRKHLTIEVGQVKPGDSARLHTRSEIKLKDGSKMGTTLNGEKLSQEPKILDGKKYIIKLGNYPHLFTLWWYAVTLSFTSLSKKSKGDPLASQREKLDQTDIKLVTEYVVNETTHAMAKKRNTPAALQALLQARWLIVEGFVDALAAIVEPTGPDGTSLLEDDFDGHWPNEADYFVESGSEPQPRPTSYLQPNHDRTEVFHDNTFIFLSQSQHDTLLPVITAGSGKALLWEVQPGESTSEDVIEYVKEVAGRKGVGQFRLSQQTGRGGVVIVRLTERDESGREFMRGIDRALGQRSIEQNEFLDAILTVNASGLRKPLEEVHEDEEPNGDARASDSRSQSQPRQQQQQSRRAVTVADSSPPAQEASRRQSAVDEQPEELLTTAAKKRSRRVITQSRFKGFDDFDPSQFSKPASQSPEPSFDNAEPSQALSVQSMDVDEPSQPPPTKQRSRKRPAPVEDEQEEQEDMYASMLTGHAAMKRQRTAAGKNGETNSVAKSSTGSDRAAAEKVARAKKKAKEMDVMAEIHARRAREEETRRKDEESLREALSGIDISELKNLAKVEEMEMPIRERPVRGAGDSSRSDRWDAAWNGRKNFKKFRPQGQRRDGPRLQRVMVALEEVPRKGHGIGEEYWLNSATSSRSKSKSQSQSQTVRQGAARSQRADDNEVDTARFRRRLQNSREEDDENMDAEQILPEEIAGHARDEQLEDAANSTPSQTFGTDSQRKAAGKRPATQQGGGPAKKPRQSRLAAPTREKISLDDDDDDELKFRRRRR